MAETPSPFHDRRIAGALIITGLLLWLSGTFIERVAHGKLAVRHATLPLRGCGIPLDFVEVGAARWIAAAAPDAQGLLIAAPATSVPSRPNWTTVHAKLGPLQVQEQFITSGQPPPATLPELLATHGACRPGFLKIDAPGILAAQLMLDYVTFLQEHPQCHAGGVVFDPGRLAPVHAALAAVRALATVGYGEPFNRTSLPLDGVWAFGLSYQAVRDGRIQAQSGEAATVQADCGEGNTTSTAPTPPAVR